MTHLSYSKHDLGTRVISPNKIKASIFMVIMILGSLICEFLILINYLSDTTCLEIEDLDLLK